jgi:hypothetical protein
MAITIATMGRLMKNLAIYFCLSPKAIAGRLTRAEGDLLFVLLKAPYGNLA